MHYLCHVFQGLEACAMNLFLPLQADAAGEDVAEQDDEEHKNVAKAEKKRKKAKD
jgi:hypothetical protein